MKIEITDEDLPMLIKMAERGWADGDLAEYLNGDQIQSCERVLAALGVNPYPVSGQDSKGHNRDQQ